RAAILVGSGRQWSRALLQGGWRGGGGIDDNLRGDLAGEKAADGPSASGDQGCSARLRGGAFRSGYGGDDAGGVPDAGAVRQCASPRGTVVGARSEGRRGQLQHDGVLEPARISWLVEKPAEQGLGGAGDRPRADPFLVEISRGGVWHQRLYRHGIRA